MTNFVSEDRWIEANQMARAELLAECNKLFQEIDLLERDYKAIGSKVDNLERKVNSLLADNARLNNLISRLEREGLLSHVDYQPPLPLVPGLKPAIEK